MKKIYTLMSAVLITINVFAQAPGKMSYQAVVRNSSNTLVANSSVGMRFSIVQGSANGTVSYSEEQIPTTNANGLANVEIGGNDGFGMIDWTNGPYFIKTETDPTGGSDYTITGTSELLSTPFALHAQSAGVAKYGLNEYQNLSSVLEKGTNAGNYEISNVAKMAIGTDTGHESSILDLSTTTKGFLLPRLTNPQVYAIAGPEEGLLVYNIDTKTLNIYNGTAWTDMNGNSMVLAIGQTYAGGIIFQLDASGYHGMVIQDYYLDSAPWGCSGTAIPGGDGTAIGTGNQNTTDIITGCADSPTAAIYCSNSVTNGYEDWYLPSKDEIHLAASTLKPLGIGGFGTDNIWSSSENDDYSAWIFNGNTGTMISFGKSQTYYSRGVRSF